MEGDFLKVKQEVIAFFGLALAAYVVSSISEMFSVKAQNQIWEKYLINTVHDFCSDLSLSSEKNRRLMNQWISSEALSTIQATVPFYVSMTSTVLNIVLTTVVFYLALGFLIGSAVGMSLIISLILVISARKKIATTATEVQTSKIAALVGLDSLVVNGHFGTPAMVTAENIKFSSRAGNFFAATQFYVKLEQLVACVPIVISVLIVCIALSLVDSKAFIQYGALVALLPRTLQLFGSVHSLSMYLSHFLMVRQKIHNLNTFSTTLERQSFQDQIDTGRLQILDVARNQRYSYEFFLKMLKENELTRGRLLVVGDNGVGKSSLLKLVKAHRTKAILVTPGARFGKRDDAVSTGQAQVAELLDLLNEDADVLLLDEWDANLDQTNRLIIDSFIMDVSQYKLVIEVRHGHLLIEGESLKNNEILAE